MVVIFSTDRKRVVITGFSNFQDDESNPSWEGVKCMNGREIENKYDITLFRKEIAVTYDKVDTQMWHYYQPHLTIHVRLNEAVQSFVLHKRANNQGDHTLNDDEHGPDVVSTTLNVDKICSKFNNCKRIKLQDPTLRAESSNDAEKYLAEYIYYISVGRSTQSPTLFVHVPFNKYTSEQLAYGLDRILELCLKQLSEDDYYSYDVDIDNKL